MQKSFDTPGPIRLDLRLPSGRIEIEAAATAVTEVRLEGPDELLERTVVDLQGDELRIEIRDRKGIFGSFGRSDLDVSVRCPEGSSLVARTASADLRARGRLAAVKAQTASGDIAVEEAAEALTIQTASGDVEVGRALGSLTVQGVSGDVRVREAAEGAQVTNVSGDVALGTVAGGGVKVQSVSGDVEVGVRRGSHVHVDASTLSGDTRSELDLDDRPVGGEAGPLVELRIKTVSGDISIVRAPAPTPQEV
jgi:DUF4097 and DUF4098 domain-containing protein YvlB